MTLNDLGPKIKGFVSFFSIFSCGAHFKSELRLQMEQDNLRIGTAKAVARFMSFAEVTCKTNY